MILNVRGKDFRIELVNMYCYKLYSELEELAKDASIAQVKMTAIPIDDEFANRSQELDDLYKVIKSAKDDMIRLRYEIIKELCESNDIEYDEKWWYRKASDEDANTFVLSCLAKDNDVIKSSVKKK